MITAIGIIMSLLLAVNLSISLHLFFLISSSLYADVLKEKKRVAKEWALRVNDLKKGIDQLISLIDKKKQDRSLKRKYLSHLY